MKRFLAVAFTMLFILPSGFTNYSFMPTGCWTAHYENEGQYPDPSLDMVMDASGCGTVVQSFTASPDTSARTLTTFKSELGALLLKHFGRAVVWP